MAEGTERKGRAPALTVTLESTGPFDPEDMPVRDAKAVLRGFYRRHGYTSLPELLTPPTSQPKLGKSIRPAYGLHLAPADMVSRLLPDPKLGCTADCSHGDGWDTCIWRTPECTAVCVLRTGGRSIFGPTQRARVLKTLALAEHPQAFVTVLAAEIDRAARKHGGIDLRLNVASDLRWERFAPALIGRANVRNYDYTKAPATQRETADSYPLTFSVSEKASAIPEALAWLRSGGNVAVVFERKTRADWDGILPEAWESFPVIDGDVSDSRADDAPGTVVGLRAKGSAIGIPGGDGFVKAGR